jgi:hypothetical protein
MKSQENSWDFFLFAPKENFTTAVSIKPPHPVHSFLAYRLLRMEEPVSLINQHNRTFGEPDEGSAIENSKSQYLLPAISSTAAGSPRPWDHVHRDLPEGRQAQPGQLA